MKIFKGICSRKRPIKQRLLFRATSQGCRPKIKSKIVLYMMNMHVVGHSQRYKCKSRLTQDSD